MFFVLTSKSILSMIVPPFCYILCAVHNFHVFVNEIMILVCMYVLILFHPKEQEMKIFQSTSKVNCAK